MLAVILSLIAWATGVYKVYDALPAWIHGLCDFALGFAVAWIWRGIHGPIL